MFRNVIEYVITALSSSSHDSIRATHISQPRHSPKPLNHISANYYRRNPTL